MEDHVEAGRVLAEAKKNWDDEPSAKEAWALMKYQCETCLSVEVIWNARPHVTPFGIGCPHCGGSMTHRDFARDVVDRCHEPKRGDLIFIDIPPELALIYARRRIAQVAASGYGLPAEYRGEPDRYAQRLAFDMLADFGGHGPIVMRMLS